MGRDGLLNLGNLSVAAGLALDDYLVADLTQSNAGVGEQGAEFALEQAEVVGDADLVAVVLALGRHDGQVGRADALAGDADLAGVEHVELDHFRIAHGDEGLLRPGRDVLPERQDPTLPDQHLERGVGPLQALDEGLGLRGPGRGDRDGRELGRGGSIAEARVPERGQLRPGWQGRRRGRCWLGCLPGRRPGQQQRSDDEPA